MLPFRSHWHFAHDRDPTRENRGIWFSTGSGDDDTHPDSLEAAPAWLPEDSEHAEQGAVSTEELAQITVGVRGSTNRLNVLTETVVKSPYVLENAKQVLDNPNIQERFPQINFTILLDRIDQLIMQEITDDEEVDQTLLTQIEVQIDKLLNDEEIAMQVTKALGRRNDRYDELREQIGDADLRGLVAKHAEMQMDTDHPYQLGLLENTDRWEEHEVDALLQELNIIADDPLIAATDEMDNEQRAALEAALQNTEVSPQDIDASGNLTKDYKLKLLYKKLTAAKKLAVMEKNDLGSETTIENFEEVETILGKQMLSAKKYLSNMVWSKAHTLQERFGGLRTELHDRYANNQALIQRELGVGYSALSLKINEVDATLQRALRKAENVVDLELEGGEMSTAITDDEGNLPDVADEAFMSDAEKTLAELGEYDWLLREDRQTFLNELLGDEKKKHEEAAKWVTTNGKLLKDASDMLDVDADLMNNCVQVIHGTQVSKQQQKEFIKRIRKLSDIGGRIETGNATTEDYDYLFEAADKQAEANLETILTAIVNPQFLRQLRQDRQEMQAGTVTNAPAERTHVTEQLTAAEQALHATEIQELLNHETADVLNIRSQLEAYLEQAQFELKQADILIGEKGVQALRSARLGASKLLRAIEELRLLTGDRPRVIEVATAEEYATFSGTPETQACYSHNDGNIYLNASLIGSNAEKEAFSHHEIGHAIIDTLMRRIGILPNLLIGMNRLLQQPIENDPQGRNYDTLLMERTADWKVDLLRDKVYAQERARVQAEMPRSTDAAKNQLATMRANARIREYMMDELLNKYATWERSGKSMVGQFPADEPLFQMLDRGDPYEQPKVEFREDFIQAIESDDIIALQQTGNQQNQQNPNQPEPAKNTTEKIDTLQNDFLLIEEFIKSHEDLENINILKTKLPEKRQQLRDDIITPFKNGSKTEDDVKDDIERLETWVGNVKGEMERIEGEELDLNDAQVTGSMSLRGIFLSVQFVSVMDIINMGKSGWEDLERMWKRRGEKVQAQLGSMISGWVPDFVPYAGQLKHEYKRRSHASELEEVNQWKEALKDVDAFELQDLLGKSRNRDQIRAALEILTEKGRLNWNDEKLWDTLSELSHYSMPNSRCRNNGVLRDKWLQKLITDIWDDADHFFNWRQANDNGIDSGKKKFTQAADQLANVGGGLDGNLRRQLTKWKECKRNGTPVPGDVHPHLYEEVIHYSMRNGKMSMEDKLYYLVQGVAAGLISVDRLQALAGENGGVLNQFPFIDYFYHKNNSLPEIKALAARLDEGGGDMQDKPGAKTTAWIHLELARTESAQLRMSKAMSGARTEQLDHEDIPTLIAQADYKGAAELTGVLSGSRFKISYEAAKNAQTGFGTKFKMLGRLAQLANENKAQFTQQDSLEIAKSVTSFIHMDNILTERANDGNQRLALSFDQLNTKAPSSSGLLTSEYRAENYKFVRALVDKLTTDAGFQWSNVSSGHGSITQDQYLRTAADETSIESLNKDQKAARFNTTAKFSEEITRVLKTSDGQRALIEVISGSADNLYEENYAKKGIPSTEHHINKDLVENYLDERAQWLIAA